MAQEQKRCVDGTLPREVKKVRKAHNRRQEWNMMAFDKELWPDHRHHHHPLHRVVSSEGSLSPEGRFVSSQSADVADIVCYFKQHLCHNHIATKIISTFLNNNNINGYIKALNNIISERENAMQTLTLKDTLR